MIVYIKIYEMFKPIFLLNPRIDWAELTINPNAIHILEKNLDKVKWEGESTVD